MKNNDSVCYSRHAVIFIFIVSTVVLLLIMLPPGTGAELGEASPMLYEPATFDLFSMFPKQVISPSTGRTMTLMPVETRNIADVTEWTKLSAHSESPYFNAMVIPSLVRPSGAKGTAKSWVLVTSSPDTPEGTVGYIKVTGVRGSEQHRVWLSVTAQASLPQLSMSAGDPFLGQGYRDPTLQAFVGEPLAWQIEATNRGGARDTYALSWEADFPCQVRFQGLSNVEENLILNKND